MSEEEFRKWDIIIKGVVTPVVTVLTVLFGLWQYMDGRKRAMEREYALRRIEREEKQMEEKRILYKEARQILSLLATGDTKSAVYLSKETRFWELYWGDLAAVESAEIESFMVQFGRLLNEWKTERKIDAQSSLQQISLKFAHQTKIELGEENN